MRRASFRPECLISSCPPVPCVDQCLLALRIFAAKGEIVRDVASRYTDQLNIARSGLGIRHCTARGFCRAPHGVLLAPRPPPRRVGGRRGRLPSIDGAPDAPDQAETVAARAAPARAMQERRPDPPPRLAKRRLRRLTHDARPRL
jgi:hypothetical protein